MIWVLLTVKLLLTLKDHAGETLEPIEIGYYRRWTLWSTDSRNLDILDPVRSADEHEDRQSY